MTTNGHHPTTFDELGDDSRSGGTCPRCGDAPEVRLEVKATEPRPARSTGAGRTIKREVIAMCERCAVECYVLFCRAMHQPRREQPKPLPGAAR
jgi:hypothetical protein